MFSDRALSLVFIFKNSTLVQKSINSAIQRLLIFVFRLSSAYVILFFRSSSELVSKFKNSVRSCRNRSRARSKDILFVFSSEIDQERDPKTFFFFSSEIDQERQSIQRHLFFFSSEIEQERDPKTFNFFQIELWVDIHFFLKSSSELVSKFKNSIRLWKPEHDLQILNFFQSELWFGFYIQKFYSSSEIDQERDPKTLNFCFQIELCVRYFMFSDRAQSWFLNSKILF